MRSQFLRWLLGLVAATALAAISGMAAGQTPETWKAPRTVDGHPDLQGVWSNNTATPLERPAFFEGKERLTDEELANIQQLAAEARDDEQAGNLLGGLLLARLLDPENAREFDPGTGNYNSFWLVERELDNRTSLIVNPPDGCIPPMTETALTRPRRRVTQRNAASHEELPLNVRCISYGVPNLLQGYNSYFQIMQGRDHVVILQELIHDARIIPLGDRPHLAPDIRQLHGDSRGYFEGDTLVVETTNYSPEGGYRGANDNLTVVERFTRVSTDMLTYEITFGDPTTWTSPWTLMIPLKRSDDAVFEYACHEGNYGMVGILAGARADERAAGPEQSR